MPAAMEQNLLYIWISFSIIFLVSILKLLLPATPYKNLPPGPPSLPILGHLHLLLKPPIHRTYSLLSQKYGAVVSLRLGSRLVVVVSSPSAVEECFTKNDVILANRPRLLLGKHLHYNYNTIVLSPYGDHWRNLRRIGAIEIFSSSRLNMFLSIRKDEIKRLLFKLSHNSLQGFAKVEMKTILTDLAFNIMMRMVAGKRYWGDEVSNEAEARRFREIIKDVVDHSGAANVADFLPNILKWIGIDGYESRVRKLAERTDTMMQGLIDEHRTRKKSTTMNTMVDHLLSFQESQPEYYTDQIIKGFILILLLAGTDTSSVTLEWAMANLLNHPHVLKKARVELDEHVGQQQLLDEADLSKLPYLKNIISETLRLNPASPMLVPHFSSDDCKVGGYDVPRGTILLVNAWAIHRDPKVWEDPGSFKPERFEVDDPDQHYKLLPFGIGRRACPGVGLAHRVIRLTLGSLIQCFEWERVGEDKIDMSEGKGITMPKVVPLEALCKARSIMKNVLTESS